ncbi:hypothetical protein [Arthrobacter rhombi]|uniref:hypothetical protein n=1 Tax=Arthrobacter rhombi TaxID=71253 RepID=UPI003FD4DE62
MDSSADDPAETTARARRAEKLAARLADPLEADGAVTALRQAEELKYLADDLLVATAGRAHDAGLSWQDIGNQLGISRQAAYQRFASGSSADDGRRREDRELVQQIRELFAAIDSGDIDRIGTEFTPRMLAQVPPSTVRALWADAVDSLGPFDRLTAATVRRNGSTRFVHCSLVFADGLLEGRAAVDRSGKVAGLLITDPGFTPPAG